MEYVREATRELEITFNSIDPFLMYVSYFSALRCEQKNFRHHLLCFSHTTSVRLKLSILFLFGQLNFKENFLRLQAFISYNVNMENLNYSIFLLRGTERIIDDKYSIKAFVR